LKDFDTDEEKVANNIKSNPSTEEPTETKFKNKIPRPTGVRLLGIFQIVFGISLIAFAIFLGASVMLLLMGSVMNTYDTAMGSLGGIGSVVDMPIPLGMGGMDPTMMSFLDMSDELLGIGDLLNTSEIERGATNSAALVMDIEGMMGVMTDTFFVVFFMIFLGIIACMVGRSLLRAKKWARIATIVFAIIFIPFAVLFVNQVNNPILLGSVFFDGIILYYMLRPRVRMYFAQTPIKNSIKNSKIDT